MAGQPTEIPAEKAGDMLRCFLNPDTACGPACMAFITNPLQQGDYRDQPWAHCHLLVNAHRVGKHLVIIAEGLSKMGKGPDPAVQHQNIPPPKVE